MDDDDEKTYADGAGGDFSIPNLFRREISLFPEENNPFLRENTFFIRDTPF